MLNRRACRQNLLELRLLNSAKIVINMMRRWNSPRLFLRKIKFRVVGLGSLRPLPYRAAGANVLRAALLESRR